MSKPTAIPNIQTPGPRVRWLWAEPRPEVEAVGPPSEIGP